MNGIKSLYKALLISALALRAAAAGWDDTFATSFAATAPGATPKAIITSSTTVYVYASYLVSYSPSSTEILYKWTPANGWTTVANSDIGSSSSGGVVNTLYADGGVLYVGISGTASAGSLGAPLKGVARFNPSTGVWTGMNQGLQINGSVFALGVGAKRQTPSGADYRYLYCGGDLTVGTSQDFARAQIDSWGWDTLANQIQEPQGGTQARVNSIVINHVYGPDNTYGHEVYLGGRFKWAGAHANLKKFNDKVYAQSDGWQTLSGYVTKWHYDCDGVFIEDLNQPEIWAMTYRSGTVHFTGDFSKVNGTYLTCDIGPIIGCAANASLFQKYRGLGRISGNAVQTLSSDSASFTGGVGSLAANSTNTYCAIGQLNISCTDPGSAGRPYVFFGSTFQLLDANPLNYYTKVAANAAGAYYIYTDTSGNGGVRRWVQ